MVVRDIPLSNKLLSALCSRSSRRRLNVLLERIMNEQQRDTVNSSEAWKVGTRSMMLDKDLDDETYMNYDMQV